MNISAEMVKWSALLKSAALAAQHELSRVALDDCNKFCKVDSGATRDSSYRASSFSRGKLVWNTKYARHAYYLGEADRSKNPLASRLWAHKATALYSDKWRQAAKQRLAAFLQRKGI